MPGTETASVLKSVLKSGIGVGYVAVAVMITVESYREF